MIERWKRVGLRLTDEEHKFVWEQAAASKLSVSEFIRRLIMGKQIVPKADLMMLGELRRLGGLLKHIHLETRGIYSEDTRSAIQDIGSCARELTKNFKRENTQADKNAD